MIPLRNYIDRLDNDNFEATIVTLSQWKQTGICKTYQKYAVYFFAIELGRQHHMKKQGWVYSINMVVLQYDNPGKGVVDKLPRFKEPVFTGGTCCTFAD